MTRTRPSGLLSWVFGFVILCGAAAIWWQVNVLQTQNASLHWPTATGTIFQSSRTYSDGNEHANVVYRYEVNGTRYISRQISLWSPDLGLWVSSSDLQKFVSAHPEGSQLTVYYDPKQVENAVLIPGAHERGDEFMIGTAAFCTLAAIGGIFVSARRRRVLEALLNDPDAQTRTIRMRKGDIEKGRNGILINFVVAAGFLLASVGFLIIPFLDGPVILLEAPRTTPTWRPVAGAACILGFVFFIVRAMRRGRTAQCPLCRNLLGKTAFQERRCGGCGTRILFEDQIGGLHPAGAQAAAEQTETRRPRLIFEFRISRFIDVAGFMASPILFVWFLAAFAKQFEYLFASLFTILFCVLGVCYYALPDTSDDTEAVRSLPAEPTAAAESEQKPGHYLLDFIIILLAPVALLCYLLYLTWQHHLLDLKSLVSVAIGFPAGIGIVSYIYHLRLANAEKSKHFKFIGFVHLGLIGLWVSGTFISIVFLVCLACRLKWFG